MVEIYAQIKLNLHEFQYELEIVGNQLGQTNINYNKKH